MFQPEGTRRTVSKHLLARTYLGSLPHDDVDLYLIQPPPGVHAPIPPSKIVLNGGSAGGGLVLALLQILRDVALPLPAGAVLVSPWTDLTHSFPSVFKNTATVSYLPLMDERTKLITSLGHHS